MSKRTKHQCSLIVTNQHQMTNYQIFQQYAKLESVVYMLQKGALIFFLKVEKGLCIIQMSSDFHVFRT